LEKERPIKLPDIDREIEELNRQLLELVHELRRLEDYIRGEETRLGPAPWIPPLRTQAAEMRRAGKAMYGRLCELQRLSYAAELAELLLEHERGCPHCSRHLLTH